MSGYPTGRTGDRGDRKEFYVQKFYVPFLLPRNNLGFHSDGGIFKGRRYDRKQCFVRALELDPKNAAAWVNLAGGLFDDGGLETYQTIVRAKNVPYII